MVHIPNMYLIRKHHRNTEVGLLLQIGALIDIFGESTKFNGVVSLAQPVIGIPLA